VARWLLNGYLVGVISILRKKGSGIKPGTVRDVLENVWEPIARGAQHGWSHRYSAFGDR
jgi:hypothetical protein